MGEPLNSTKTKSLLIAVCVKQVDYTYGRSGLDSDGRFIDPRDRVRINNPADEEALELAVRLKETEENAEVWVFSLGTQMIPQEAARALAIGADRFVWLSDPAWRDLDARGTAAVLAAAVKKAGADLVLCGTAALDTGRGEVGPFIGYHLGLSFVSSVTAVSLMDQSKRVYLQSALGRGDRMESIASFPLVMSVSSGTLQPRYPSHVRMVTARAQLPLCWDSRAFPPTAAVDEKHPASVRVIDPRPRVKPISAPDGELPAFERVRQLLSASAGKKTGTLLQGEAGELAKSLVTFLRERGFWRGEPREHETLSPE